MRGIYAVSIILPLDIIVIPKQAFAPLLQTGQEYGENGGLSQLDIYDECTKHKKKKKLNI
jgi:hypothetical protein